MRRLLHLCLALAFACSIVSMAQQQDQKAAPDPLIRLLQSKGILTEQEAASINQTGTAAEQQKRLSQLLLSKGIISQDEYNQTFTSSSKTGGGSAAFVPAVAHLSPDPSSATAAAPAPPDQKGPAIIPAVAPIRVLQSEPSKPGGLIPDIKLGSGAKIKFYGFLKATTQYDTSDPQNLDFLLPWNGSNGTVPQAIPVGGNSPFANIGGVGNTDTGPYGDPQFRVEARQSRVGANFEWPDVAGSRNAVTGRLELDFEGNYSRAQNRNVSSLRTSMAVLRLAWLRIDHHVSDQTNLFTVIGMDWTPFASSTLPNLLETTGLGVFFGNPYERAMQFRGGIFHDFGGDRHFSLGIEPAVVMPIFGNQPADVAVQLGVSERQGADSARPDIQGRVFFQWQLDKAKGVAPAQIIFSGVNARRTAIVTLASLRAATCGNALTATVSATGTVTIPVAAVTPPCFATTTVAGVPVNTPVDPLLAAAFPRGAQTSSDRYGVTAEVQLPTRYMTLIGKVYNGEDLRFYFANQIFSTYNANIAGLLSAPPGTPGVKVCGATGGGCPSAFNMDASTSVLFGFNPTTGAAQIIPQRPVRTEGGFGQISFPLSRIFNANPEGRNAGWTLAFTYGIDYAKARDVKFMSPAGNRGKSDMMVATLFWKLNQYLTFGYESSLYRTRAYCSAGEQAAAQTAGAAVGACPAFIYRGVASREWHDFRNQFGPTITF